MLHFAGGNKYSFRFLQNELNNYETIPLELPGRGARFDESLIFDISSAIKDLFRQIKKNLTFDDVFIVYGHSMGAKLGFYVINELEKEGFFPKCFIASGNAGPGIARDKIRYNLPDDEFISELKKLGGSPPEFFTDKDLYEFFSPIMRADFQAIEAEEENVDFKIKAPIYALMGDKEEGSADISNWAKYCETFQFKLLPGDHFFIHDNKLNMVDIINECINAN